jgi:hypothetical protein
MSDAPNFRLSVRAEGDDCDVPTTLREFLADNEGAPEVCAQVQALEPGQEVVLGGGAGVAFHVRRFNVGSPRYTRVRVPIDLKEFRGASTATVTIDRKRLTLSIRPFQRRMVFEISLTELAELYLAKQVKVSVAAKKKARRSRR